MFVRLVLALAAFVAFAQAGDFIVLHSPEDLIFDGEDQVEQNLLKDVYSAALGFTTKMGTWKGMFYDNPFDLPEAVVAVVVEGVDTLGKVKGKKMILKDDKYEEFIWQSLSAKVQRFESREKENFFARMSLSDGVDALGQSVLGELKPNSTEALRRKAPILDNPECSKFLDEIQLLHAIADKARKSVHPNNEPDVFWLIISGLKPIIDTYGKNSVAAKEALTLLDETLQVVNKAFKRVYNNKVLITALTNTAASPDRQARSTNSRTKREAEEKAEETTTKKIDTSATNKEHEDEYKEEKFYEETFENLAPKYKEDYPVVFNIVFWFMVVFFFSLLAICIFIAEMDPGRDSIIYRMTSNRMKKDN